MPPSILMIGNYLPGALGASTVGHEIAARLRDSGWQVFTTSSRVGRIARLADMVRTLWARRREFEVAQVDVFSGPAFIWAEVVCGMLVTLRKPFVLTLHGGRLPEFAARFPRRVSRLLRAAQAVTTPSTYLSSEMGKFRADLRVLPNGLDLGAYPFRQRDQPRPRLVWLRSFHRIYDPELAASVLGRLAGEFSDLHLAMVGPDGGDDSRERTLREADRQGVGPLLEMPGGVPKSSVHAWLDQADIFLNTTRIDNTPISVLEAMASGLCVVSTNPGGIPHLLTSGHDALLAPCGDAEALATGVRRLLTEPGLAARLSRNGRSNAERFDWSVVLPQWHRLLSDLRRSVV